MGPTVRLGPDLLRGLGLRRDWRQTQSRVTRFQARATRSRQRTRPRGRARDVPLTGLPALAAKPETRRVDRRQRLRLSPSQRTVMDGIRSAEETDIPSAAATSERSGSIAPTTARGSSVFFARPSRASGPT